MLNMNARTSRRVWALAAAQAGEVLWMMALTRASLFSDLSPFSVAWFSAALAAGRPPWAMLVGCALGCPWEVLGVFAAAPLAGCLMVWGARWALKRGWAGPGDAQKPGLLGGEDVIICALAGVGALAPSLACAALGPGGAAGYVGALACALTAAAFAPVLRSAASFDPRRTRLLPEELLSLTIAAMLCLMGINASPARFLAPPLAALMALAAGCAGPAQGAAAGVIAGAALAFSGNDPLLGAATGLMGLIAGVAVPLGRHWAALAFLLANVACAAFGTGSELGTLKLPWALAAAVAFALIPEGILEKTAQWLDIARPAVSPQRLAERLRQSGEKRLRALSAVFSDLAEGYGDVPPGPDEQAYMAQMRRALCGGCPGYAACWNGGSGCAGRMLCQLLCEALRGFPLAEEAEMPPEWGHACRRAAQAPRKLGPLLRSFASRRRAALEKRGGAATMGRHFAQAARILEDASQSMARPLRLDERLSGIALAALERAGLWPEEAIALEGDAVEVYATIRDGLWGPEDARRAARVLSRALGVPLRAALGGSASQRALRLVQSPRLAATVGCAARAREKDAPCGDSHLASGLTGARVLMALSDGMGSGARAARESADTIRLIRRFLLAEVEDQLMLDAVNQLMLLRGGEDMYATADLCVMDLEIGQARFLKLGACASFLLRRGEVRRIEGGRLPLGILDGVSPAVHHVALRPGDTVVMVTDGIAEGADEAQNLWLCALLKTLCDQEPAALCDKVIEAAARRPSGVRDDMTVLAARIQRAR